MQELGGANRSADRLQRAVEHSGRRGMDSEDQENVGDHHNIPGTSSQAEADKENQEEAAGPCPSRSRL